MKPQIFAIAAFNLTTRDPERLIAFYTGLGFGAGPPERIPNREIDLLKLRSGGTRVSLRLAESSVTIDCFDQPGRGYPLETTAADLCFQHFAIVTADAEAAWTRAMNLGATPISRHGPVTLPRSSGGVTACKFRDPEGHPLEFLQFPNDSGNDQHAAGSRIDHSALCVSDLHHSRRFYEALGLTVEGATLNQGEAQQELDDLPRPVVDVLPMMPFEGNSHIELLAYRNPVGRPITIDAANDVVATRVVWKANRDEVIRDPDGHIHVLRNW